jgi:hypothetical protein
MLVRKIAQKRSFSVSEMPNSLIFFHENEGMMDEGGDEVWDQWSSEEWCVMIVY